MVEHQTKIELDDIEAARALCGGQGSHLAIISRRTGAAVDARGSQIIVTGPTAAAELACRVIRELYQLVKGGYTLFNQDVEQAVKIIRDDPATDLATIFTDTVYVASRHRFITPKGPGQKRFIDAIRRHDMVFALGPAGTGKTYLAMAAAVAALTERKSKRIILCRPAVEAGEKLGFLPGDLAEKVNPYLRPLYDALHDMMDFERAQGLVSRGIIEVAPLAFMRGRTLNEAFVILDEAQNTTSEQMKMFLTRLGYGSKVVINGDITQIDLPGDRVSGLLEARNVLKDVEGVAFCSLGEIDVVRHPLVHDIIRAYERHHGDGTSSRHTSSRKA
ncbi:MAG: PhoH family protein [Myxococcota bacterium]